MITRQPPPSRLLHRRSATAPSSRSLPELSELRRKRDRGPSDDTLSQTFTRMPSRKLDHETYSKHVADSRGDCARVPGGVQGRLRMKTRAWMLVLACFSLLAQVARGDVERSSAPERSDVGVTEHLGDALPLDAPFVDHNGRDVKLGDYFTSDRAVVLIFGYHTCPMLCSLVQNAAAQALRRMGLVVGRDYDVVVISIDPEDTRHTATKRRDIVLATYSAGLPASRLASD